MVASTPLHTLRHELYTATWAHFADPSVAKSTAASGNSAKRLRRPPRGVRFAFFLGFAWHRRLISAGPRSLPQEPPREWQGTWLRIKWL